MVKKISLRTCTVGEAFADFDGEVVCFASVKQDSSNETGEYFSVSSKEKARLTASICLPLLTKTSITPENFRNADNACQS